MAFSDTSTSPAKTGASEPASERCRIRDLGLIIGRYPPGDHNAITDVSGVRVGHVTLMEGTGRLRVGHGPIRTGVTAIIPGSEDVFHQRVVGGSFILNGAGEMAGLTQVSEWGLIETPILLTNTLSVGVASEACAHWMIARHPGIGRHHDVVLPIVGECDDSWLNDIAGRHVAEAHVFEALDRATGGPVGEGNVGGGTGMVTFDLKGGIGTASRRLPRGEGGYTLGMLVMSNFGRLVDLRARGLPLGERLAPDFRQLRTRPLDAGSIIAVFATDAPLLAHQLQRIAKRVALGIARAGSYAAHRSGEIVLGFSTANRVPRSVRRRLIRMTVLSDLHLDPLYRAAIEATEEAILNAIAMAEPMEGINRRYSPALPLDRVRTFLAEASAFIGSGSPAAPFVPLPHGGADG